MITSHMCNVEDSHTSSIGPNTKTVKQSSRTISDTERSFDVIGQDIQLEDPILHSGRSGRALRLLTRFR
jgi:hypothetical protein